MNIEKVKIVDLPMVYVTAELTLGGKRYLAAVSEAPGEHAYIIDPETCDYAELWQGDTGVMNVIQIPGTDKLLTITRFYPIFQSKEAAICLLEPTQKGYMSPWRIREVLRLPFCHRIGIVRNPNGLFVLGCALCEDKAYQEDWNQPGAIYMAPIPQNTDGEWKLTKVFGGLTKNHGLHIEDGNQVYICAENGVLHFDMADYRAGEERMPTLISATPTSDISIAHVDGARMAGVIEPFHGDTLALYALDKNRYALQGRWDISFGHVVWLGEVLGQPAIIAGSRGGDRQLELIFIRTGERIELDRNVGPTQISVYRDGGRVKILAANHGAGEVSLYTLTA